MCKVYSHSNGEDKEAAGCEGKVVGYMISAFIILEPKKG
jgi:hypothetical protein